MVNFKLNALVKSRQARLALIVVTAVSAIIILIASAISPKKPQRAKTLPAANITGIVESSFTDALAEEALTVQQGELDSVKAVLEKMQQKIDAINTAHEAQIKNLTADFEGKLASMATHNTETAKTQKRMQLAEAEDPFGGMYGKTMQDGTFAVNHSPETVFRKQQKLAVVSFRKRHQKRSEHYPNPATYVPSNTSVRAVILGGADSDASVNGQSKNNGVMLLKFIDNGTLPNGQRSRLAGCRASVNSYGDISSERAIATLYKLSCARPGEPIIDKLVNGWVFYKGKAGIKGKPLMRDSKIMQWAGVSGALSGIAEAAQYAQSVQQIGTFGASSVVPSGNIAPFAAYGGASKAADALSQYYIKRAEQYHPVIQVGAGNEVTVVFEHGFYLEPEDEHIQHAEKKRQAIQTAQLEIHGGENSNDIFEVPEALLNRIDRTYAANTKRGYP